MKEKKIEGRKKLALRVDREYLLREAEHFREHKKGIPEWIKNSDDSYNRHEDNEDHPNFSDLPIIINFDKDGVTCLDFGGASGKDVFEHIPYYGSSKAATFGKKLKTKEVSGGHGNGGKYYALSQFKECQIMSYFNGKLSILTIDKTGDFEDKNDIEATPDEVIDIISLDKWNYFRVQRKDLFEKISNGELNLFCWEGIEPRDVKGISRNELANLVRLISNNPQTRSALRSRIVDILSKGNLFWPHLQPEQAEIDANIGTKEFILPNKLSEYEFNKKGSSILKISFSKEPLTGDKSSLNILEIDANGRNIAYYDLPSFMMDRGLSKSIIAHIDCPELKEYKCVSNDRVHLIDIEISRMFLIWCRERIQEVLDEICNKEKKEEEQKDLEKLGNFLKDILNEVSDLLEEDILTRIFDKKGTEKSIVKVPSDKPGYGGEGKIETPDKGQRRGGTEEKEGSSSQRKTKSKLQILISNKDLDPLNPEKTYDMIERQPILFQRIEDVEHGIWWINSTKRYVRKLKIEDPATAPFCLFLVKEVVFSQRSRQLEKDQDRFDTDGIEDLNFGLIDEIFSRVVQKLGIQLTTEGSNSEKMREFLRTKKRFTISEMSEELEIDPNQIHIFLNNPTNGVEQNFDIRKRKIRGQKGGKVNFYISKGP